MNLVKLLTLLGEVVHHPFSELLHFGGEEVLEVGAGGCVISSTAHFDLTVCLIHEEVEGEAFELAHV